MAKSYIFFNKLANNGRGNEHIGDAKKQIGGEIECYDVDALDVRELISTLGEDDKVILCGGDGTLNRFANKIYGLDVKCSLYLEASGTGNDFINDIEHTPKDKLVYINDYIKNLPVVFVNGEEIRFINGVGVGIDGAVCAEGDRKKKKGKAKVNYTLLAVKMILLKYRPCGAEITIDGVTKRYEKIWMAPTMQGRFFGGGMKVAPMQDRKSGKLTSMLIHRKVRLITILRFLTVFKGNHVKYKDMVDWCYADEIKVKFDRPTEMQIDGEVILGVSEYTVKSADISNGKVKAEKELATAK